MHQPPDSLSFTSTSTGGLLGVLKNRCSISQAFDPAAGGSAPAIAEFIAIWDTGATNSAITQAVVDACGLAPIGVVETHGVHGTQLADVYLVNIYLPNNVAFPAMKVTKGKLLGADILIGMDVISQGDFAVTNFKGLTKFSFRMPSKRHIDFVDEYKNLMNQFVKNKGHGKNKQKKK